MNRSVLMALTLGVVSLWAGSLVAQPSAPSKETSPGNFTAALQQMSERMDRLEQREERLDQRIQQVLDNQRLILEELEKIRMRVLKS